MAKLEITNMVMVRDRTTGKVVVIDRVISWKGIAFSGGHAEDGESIYDSAVREIREETGLTVQNLKACGLVYWFHNKTGDRYFVHCYRTGDFSGELFAETGEGRVFWADPAALLNMALAPNFEKYLKLFLEDRYTEAYCSWNDESPKELLFR